jgi:hypothetical protein
MVLKNHSRVAIFQVRGFGQKHLKAYIIGWQAMSHTNQSTCQGLLDGCWSESC